MELPSTPSGSGSSSPPDSGGSSGVSRSIDGADDGDVGEGTATWSLSVVVPTFNEAENVERVITRCQDAMEGLDYELIIVDDDSPDGTWRVAEAAAGENGRVHVIRRQSERGLGTAVVAGFDRATKEFCAVIDADLQHPPELLPELANHITEYVDIVIGSRYRKGGRVVNWPASRHVISRGAIALTKLCLEEARGLNDPLSGFFLVRRSVVDDADLQPQGYKILLEVLIQCEYAHVVEVPYEFDERKYGASKLTIDSCRAFLAHLLTLRSRA
jgi:dolichol-phosphate mannosyltransferase